MKEIEDLFDMEKYGDKVRSGLESIEDANVYLKEKEKFLKRMSVENRVQYVVRLDPYLINYLKKENQTESLILSLIQDEVDLLSYIPKNLLERDMVLNYAFINRDALSFLVKNTNVEQKDIKFALIECLNENLAVTYTEELIDNVVQDPKVMTQFINVLCKEKEAGGIFLRSKVLMDVSNQYSSIHNFFEDNENFKYFIENYKGDYLKEVVILLMKNNVFNEFISSYKNVEELQRLFNYDKKQEESNFYLRLNSDEKENMYEKYVKEYKLTMLLSNMDNENSTKNKTKQKI